MKLLDYINQKTNNAYKDFKLVSVIFDRHTKDCTFKFLYKNEIKEEDKANLTKLIEDYLPQKVNIIVKCKKAYVDNDLVREVVFNFITKHYSSVAVSFDKNDIEVEISDAIQITINCNSFNYNHLINAPVYKEILEYCEGFFFEPIMLEIKSTKQDELLEVDLTPNNLFDLTQEESKIKYYKVDEIENVIGETKGCPIEISCIDAPMENVEISGTIRFFTQKTFESKRLDKDGNNIVKTYFSFSLVDKTGKMSCVIFPRKDCALKMLNFKDGDYVLVHGNIEDFNGRLNFKCDSIAYCVKVEQIQKEEPVVEIKKEPLDKYLCAPPEPYLEMAQDNLFASGDEIGQYLMDNDVVVFDIETTGLEVSRCEIIEIGAVKLHKGKKVETFETFIKPTGEIPDEITNLTHITNEMVKDAPNIKSVIADFYKFCYGCTIIAYNIDFDYKFVNQFGKNNGYLFDMKQIDALYLARAFIPGLKNFKLSTVCKKLGVSLENAHRAVHDAMATADVVIKLNTNIK